jgi:hypothetical protein
MVPLTTVFSPKIIKVAAESNILGILENICGYFTLFPKEQGFSVLYCIKKRNPQAFCHSVSMKFCMLPDVLKL